MSNLYFRGDNVFLYVQFFDELGNPKIVIDPRVRILYAIKGANNEVTYNEIISWSEGTMEAMSENEYFRNYQIPYNAGLGQYLVAYKGTVDEKEAFVMETFHVLVKSEKYENAIKLYGYVNDIRTNCALMDAAVIIESNENNEIVSQVTTNEDGYWEAFVYPGDYKFTFSKEQFQTLDIAAQIGDEHNEMQFNNIGLESNKYKDKGNGIYSVGDKYVTKHGTPLVGLNISIANIFKPKVEIANAVTNEDGEWECFLDPGTYFLKVNNIEKKIDKKFRLKLNDNGEFEFEDLSKNNAIVADTNYVGPGEKKEGNVEVSSTILDKNGNPIIDVQVNAFKPGSAMNDSDIIAQTYTDPNGKWELSLKPGNYIIEFYHPKFKVITQNCTVS